MPRWKKQNSAYLECKWMNWYFKHFNELTTQELYRILQARVGVFVVEQTCPYPELDGLDGKCYHLWAEDDAGSILAYLRLAPSGTRYPNNPALTRVLTTEKARGLGLGKELTTIALEKCAELWPNEAIRISAQSYLESFYGSFGFISTGKKYLEDDIPHTEMLMEYKGQKVA